MEDFLVNVLKQEEEIIRFIVDRAEAKMEVVEEAKREADSPIDRWKKAIQGKK